MSMVTHLKAFNFNTLRSIVISHFFKYFPGSECFGPRVNGADYHYMGCGGADTIANSNILSSHVMKKCEIKLTKNRIYCYISNFWF